MITIDMIPLYMMVGSCVAMFFFLTFYKNYGSELSRFALLAFYIIIIASVTIFMVSCNYHKIGLSISMCYLFVIMIAPTYKLVDTVIVCLLILLSWWLPSKLPYADNYDLFKHFLLRASIVAGFIAIRSVFLRQSANERYVKEMSNSFIKLAYNDIMTGTLNKKAMEAYCTFITERMRPAEVSVIIYDIFRFGGEEFTVILPNMAEREARFLASELLDAVRGAAIAREDLPGKSIVTASFGVASGTNEALRDLSLIAEADKQLYVSKNSGRDCVAACGVLYR